LREAAHSASPPWGMLGSAGVAPHTLSACAEARLGRASGCRQLRQHFSLDESVERGEGGETHRKSGRARCAPKPVAMWLSSNCVPIMATVPRKLTPFSTPAITSEFHRGSNLLRRLYSTRVR
jgi:hypothetical protein